MIHSICNDPQYVSLSLQHSVVAVHFEIVLFQTQNLCLILSRGKGALTGHAGVGTWASLCL